VTHSDADLQPVRGEIEFRKIDGRIVPLHFSDSCTGLRDRKYDTVSSRRSMTALLDLVTKTEAELADLKPRDRIDVQSFIWIVGHYSTESEAPRL
jgi:hypothetical protein